MNGQIVGMVEKLPMKQELFARLYIPFLRRGVLIQPRRPYFKKVDSNTLRFYTTAEHRHAPPGFLGHRHLQPMVTKGIRGHIQRLFFALKQHQRILPHKTGTLYGQHLVFVGGSRHDAFFPLTIGFANMQAFARSTVGIGRRCQSFRIIHV